ncbi:sulfurtransferase TusA family protein [Desulfopila sp. IMCC35008]|uniref:sulfurtransferase TusA family protein n=1 Tax=Desulfopila sp. IMCC35008 TaxID=2653858 RepID=UPI0013D4A54E|nr:OsmC family protein [Desulfopila sp. IMCC35008]
MTVNLNEVIPDMVFDGGDLDCGSGLILLIREHMLKTPVDGILEMRSREPTVADDLPPWCRMSGHEYLGQEAGEGFTRYFVKRGTQEKKEEQSLKEDLDKAKKYEWRLRARSQGHLRSTVYSRNFSFEVGQPASFEEKDKNPCAVEYLFGSLAGSLTTAFATECAKENLDVDDIEISLSGALHNILAHMGLEEGDPSISEIELKCFASTFDDEDKVREVWERTVSRSPVAVTLAKAVDLKIKLALV